MSEGRLPDLSVLERWRTTADNEVDNIGGWRGDPARNQWPLRPPGGNGEPQHFWNNTAWIVGLITRELPKLDPAPIQAIYSAVNAWYTDRSANRLPPQNELEGELAQAMILINCAINGILAKPSDDAPVGSLITISQMALLVQVQVKTVQNCKVNSPLPPPVAGDVWDYTTVRPWLLKQWPRMSHRLPDSYTDAMRILSTGV